MTKPERNYTIALIVLAFLYVIAIGEFVLFLRQPLSGGDPERSRFAFELVIYMTSVFLAVAVLILLVRLCWPRQGRIVLIALNIILILSFPFGTVLGVYYL